MHTEYGKTMSLVMTESASTPLQEHLEVLATSIGKVGLAVAVVCFSVLLIRSASAYCASCTASSSAFSSLSRLPASNQLPSQDSHQAAGSAWWCLLAGYPVTRCCAPCGSTSPYHSNPVVALCCHAFSTAIACNRRVIVVMLVQAAATMHYRTCAVQSICITCPLPHVIGVCLPVALVCP